MKDIKEPPKPKECKCSPRFVVFTAPNKGKQYLYKAILFLLAIITPARAADIQVPLNVPAHTLVEFSTPAKGTGYAWFVTGPQGLVPAKRLEVGLEEVRGQRGCFAGSPGRYTLMLVVIGEGGTVDQGATMMTIGGDTPVPPPGPGPTPPPGPGPGPVPPPGPVIVPGTRGVVLIHETSDSNAEHQMLLNALMTGELAAYMEGKGHLFYALDDDAVGPDNQPAPFLKPWLEYTKDVGLPALVIFDLKSKTALGKTKLPSNVEAVKKFITDNGG